MQIIYLVKRWSHHSASTGYDYFAQEANARVIRRSTSRSWMRRALRLIWRNLTPEKTYLLQYTFDDWVAEWRLLAAARTKRPDVVHVLNGDDQMDLLLRRRSLLPCPLVVSFHLPPWRVKERFERVQKHLLGGVDMAIVVARSQLAEYQHWFGSDRVVYLPHGINTDRFTPGSEATMPGNLRLLQVGDHMRDWTTMHRVMDECRNLKLPVELDVVAPDFRFPHFTGCTNVKLHDRISEEELIRLYRGADALFMPLEDATANNALLESMACGTPVISSAIGGIPDYVDESSGWLFPKGATTEIVSLIAQLCENRQIALSRRSGARARALEFDWLQVRKQAAAVYEAAGKVFANGAHRGRRLVPAEVRQ